MLTYKQLMFIILWGAFGTSLYSNNCLIYPSQEDFIAGSSQKALTIECISLYEDPLHIFIGIEKDKGSFGDVYEAIIKEDDDDKGVVIKKIKLKAKAHEGYSRLDSDKSFSTHSAKAEFNSLVHLYNNEKLIPYLVKPYAFFQHNEHAYIVMEDGGTPIENLATQLKAENKFGDFAKQLFAAVKAIHLAGLIHLDLHPKNILLNDKNEVKIIDFGLAKPKGTTLTSAGKINYRDPYIYKFKRAYEAYDLYSIAAILFEIKHGRTIFSLVDNNNGSPSIPIKLDNDKFIKYKNVYNFYIDQCQVNVCDKLYLLILALLNPSIEKRTTLPVSY